MSTKPDVWRSQVYSAEDQFTSLLNRGGQVDFFGSTFDLSPQRRFGDLLSVQDYVNRVFDIIDGIDPPTVRVRKGTTRAHYEFSAKIIALPVADQWALRESVILHECAHHITWMTHGTEIAPHGAQFTRVMLDLVNLVLGESAELLLRAGYQEAGVPISITRVIA